MTTATITTPPSETTERTCSINECGRRHEARGLCVAHYRRLRRGTEIDGLISRPGSGPGALNPRWRGDAVGYLGAHHRVYRLRGAASQQVCAHCGAQAQHWAYDHMDPDPKVGNDGPYSLDVNRYLPLCGSCHRLFDLAHAPSGR